MALERTWTIENRLGLHARPAALFVQVAGRFRAQIKVSRDNLEVNGKSVMGLMMLAAECGSQIRVMADGPDEQEAVLELQKLFERKFDEE